jgi:MFS family permease
MMVPVGRLILVRSVPRSDLVAAMVLMSMPAVLGPALGPVLGGFIATVASWRWIFWINLPIGIAAIGLTLLLIEEVPVEERRRFDLIGFLLTAIGIGCITFAFDVAATGSGIPLDALVLGALGTTFLITYVAYARRAPAPILDLGLFRYETFRASMTGGTLFRIGFGAIPFMLPMLMQQGYGYSPLQSGLITFVTAAGSFGMRTMSNRILMRFGFRNVLTWNGVLAVLSMAALALFSEQTALLVMLLIIFFGGFFRALEFTSINTIGFADVTPAEMSHATTMGQMGQRLSQSIGVALAALLLHQFSGPGATPSIDAFSTVFAIIAAISGLSIFFFASLPASAGDTLSGRAPSTPR